MDIAYLGPPGTFTEQAVLAYLAGQPAQLYPHHSIQGTLRAVDQGKVDYAVVPVENSVEGSVGLTLDVMWNLVNLTVQAAIELPIAQALLSFSPEMSRITRVYSHAQALAQCQGWLELNLPLAQQIPSASTSEASQYLAQDYNYAAIASPRAAHLQNIPILQTAIQDYPDNRTRFWIVNRTLPNLVGERLSLAFSPRRRGPGVLMEALSLFAQRGINLTRIESRPSKKLMGEYVFFIDAEGKIPLVQEALAQLSPLTEGLRY